MSKREAILEAAAQVVVDHGINHLTLDAVAQQAGVSKGGLLYHFASKEELIEEMNALVVQRFQTATAAELLRTKSYSKAYLSATVKELADLKSLSVSSSLLATLLSDKNLLAPWQKLYEQTMEQFQHEGLSPETGLITRLVCDGLWFSKLFDLAPLSSEEIQLVIDYLHQQLHGEHTK